MALTAYVSSKFQVKKRQASFDFVEKTVQLVSCVELMYNLDAFSASRKKFPDAGRAANARLGINFRF